MPTTSNREAAPRGGRSADRRLARLLDSPLLARVVPHLAPETLHQLIQYRGLDACGQLVTSATPAQLTSVLDLDLWHHAQPGRDDQFDIDRFGEWLEVLVRTGELVAARTVAALDERLVIAGLSRYLRIFDPGTFEPTESSDDERMDRHEMMNSERGSNALECEIGGYLLRARRTDAWDAIVTLLVTLESEQHAYFHAVMAGCRRLSHSTPEIDGLDDLLMEPEQHLHDVAVDRELRRSRRGYATAADARAFLQMARQPRTASSHPAPGALNPIATAYFRAADEDADTSSEGAPAGAPDAVSVRDATEVATLGNDDAAAAIDELVELLTATGVTPGRPRALLDAAGEDPRAARLALLRRVMGGALRLDEILHLTRSRELALLANTLLAGCSVQSRSFTPQEASDAASCICNLGLEAWPARWPPSLRFGAPRGATGRASGPREGGPGATLNEASQNATTLPDAFLVDHDLVTAFEVGWSVLYSDVSLFVSDQLIAVASDLRGIATDTRRDLLVLQRTLAKHRQAGTPWLARQAADVLATLDTTAWISVLGLLDECPVLPATLTAILERRTSPVSPTAFTFISTTAQIGDIRVFMRVLPGLLTG